MGYIEASHSETSVVWGETMCLMCALVGHTSQICRDVSQANYWKLDFPAERVFHVTMNAVAKQQYCTSILHIDVNCVLTIHLPGCHVLCHRNALGHHTDSNSLAFLSGEERQSMADNKCYNQKFEAIRNSCWCFRVFQSSPVKPCVSPVFPRLLKMTPCGVSKKIAFNLIDNTSTGLEQRSSDAKPMAIAWIRECFHCEISNNEPVREGTNWLTTRVLPLWRRFVWWSD